MTTSDGRMKYVLMIDSKPSGKQGFDKMAIFAASEISLGPLIMFL